MGGSLELERKKIQSLHLKCLQFIEGSLSPFSLHHDVIQSHTRGHKFTGDNITESNSDT